MPNEIHITVPKGAKVVIHEEGEPEVELSLEERLKDLLDRLEAAPERVYIPMPYPVSPQPYIPPAVPWWDPNYPYKVTCGSGTITNAPTTATVITN